MVEMHDHAVLFRSRLQNAQALRDHFLAAAVAGNNRDPICFLAHPWDSSGLSCRALNTANPIALQWTKPRAGATLQCNVDRGGAERLPILLNSPDRHPLMKREFPWICICAASVS